MRQKYARALELVDIETIPEVGEVRLWIGNLTNLGKRIENQKGLSVIHGVMKSRLIVTISRGNNGRGCVYALFERQSEARAFEEKDYSRKVREWLLQTKPWVLPPGYTPEKTTTPPVAVIVVSPAAKAPGTERFRHSNYTRFFAKDHPAGTSGITEFPFVIGTSQALEQNATLVERVAKTDVTVLITGETGVGKELIAQYIHLKSRRRKGAFVSVNCAAVPSELFESLFFGHRKGAFTGAGESRDGLIKKADGGTLFLDEVGDLSLASQAKLLSVLETHAYRPVGFKQTFTSDFLLISATNKALREEVRRGTFREDMFHRLNVFPIHVPPLRDRREDIPLLFEFFLETLSKRMLRGVPALDPFVLPILRDYHWPGNIRELRNVVERGLVVCDDVLAQEHITLESLAQTGLNGLGAEGAL